MSNSDIENNEEIDVMDLRENEENIQESNNQQVEDEPKEKLLKLPLARVKHIAKTDCDVNMINHEASFLLTKSTELFIESLMLEAFKHTAQQKKKTVQKEHIFSAIDNVDALCFLEDMLK